MLLTTPSTVVRRLLAWVAVCCAAVALLPASTACWSASLAFADAIWMPAWARESVSLIIFVLAAVSSSSSLTRSRIGWVWRCTYFLRAKGLTLPQKPSWVSTVNGALPVALLPAVVDELSGAVDAAGCWASAGSASKKAMNNATTARFFIFYILRWGSFWLAPRCTPYAGVIAIWCVPTDKLNPALWGPPGP